LKVIVYEHVCGGGFAGYPIPQGVLAEGFAMLREMAEDFTAAGHEVTVLLDARIAKLHPPVKAFFIIPIYQPEESLRFLKSIASINDATYIIAPETEHTLQNIVESVEHLGKTSLNCTSKAIEAVANKAVLYQKLTKMGFSTPKTVVFNRKDSVNKIKQAIKSELKYPVVFKPVDGVGCQGLNIVKEESQVPRALDKIRIQSKTSAFLVQQYIEGEPTSVSCLSDGKKTFALSLNYQDITLTEPADTSCYTGGCTPFDHPQKPEALSLAEKVVDSIVGLRGYVGVDLVLAKEGAYVVDVNPRLTTSYVGLRRVAGFNIAEALIDAVVDGKLPPKQENDRFTCFSKIKITISKIIPFQKIICLSNVISPPFPLESNPESCALVFGEGDSLDEAKHRLEEAKKSLSEILI
jgi:tyramine---L-glutamate ligase